MVTIILCVTLALFLGLAVPSSSQQSSWEDLNREGTKLYQAGKYGEAAETFQKALDVATKTFGPDDPRVATCLNNLALLYQDQGRHSEAEPLYKRSLEIRELRLGKDHPDVAASLNNLALLYDAQGRYSEAEPLYKRSLEIRELRFGKDHPDVADSLNNLAELYRAQARYTEAEPLYKRSLEIYEKVLAKDHPLVATSLNNLAGLYNVQGRYSEAEPLYKRSLEIIEKTMGKNHPNVATSLNNLALLYDAQGRYSEAEPLCKRSLEIYEKVLMKDHPRVATSLNNLAFLYQDRGRYPEALTNLERSLDILKRKGLPIEGTQNLIADLYLDLSALYPELGYVEKAESIVTEVGYNYTRGRVCLVKKDFNGAKHYYDLIRGWAEENRDADSLFAAYTGLGLAYEGLEDYAHASEYYRKAIDFTEDLRSSLKREDREKFFDVKISGFYRTAPYEGYVRVMLRMNKPLEALKGSEYCKARMYAERISVLPNRALLDVPSEVLRKDEDMRNQLAAAKQGRLDAYKNKDQTRIRGRETDVARLEEQFKEHVKMLREKYPLFAATKYPQPMDVEQTAVKPQEWVLAYHVTESGIAIWLLEGKKLVKSDFKPITMKDLNERVRSFRKPLEMSLLTKENLLAFKDVMGTGKELFDILVGDFLKSIPKGRPFIIVPDGILGILPFEMLVINKGQGWNTTTKNPYPRGAVYFGDRNPISYYQSLTALTLARTLGEVKKPGPRTLVMADPVFESNDRRRGQIRLAKGPDSVSRKLLSISTEIGLRFERLDFTGDLGMALKGLQPEMTDLHTGMEANKSLLFKDPLDQYRSIVFATHGYFGEGLPVIREPVLVLTLVDQPDDEYGFLRMSEVMSLKNIRAEVVALIACQTGLGPEVKGEGPMGMGRAFQYAGAKSVLMSLWSVSVESTTEMAEEFFTCIHKGKNRLEALQEARKKIRSQGFQHPFFWAPFILVGEVQ